MSATTTTTIVTTVPTVLMEFSSETRSYLLVRNILGAALTSFAIQARNADNAPWLTVLSSPDTPDPFGTATSFLETSNPGSPGTLALNATWQGTLNSSMFYRLRLIATSGTSTTIETTING